VLTKVTQKILKFIAYALYELSDRKWHKHEVYLIDFDDNIIFHGSKLGGFESSTNDPTIKICQYTGLTDSNGKEYYIGDIAEFDNGDRFVLRMEDWLEVFADWVGDPECEDQTRDLYRISNAKIIGNIHENPELLKQSE